jgi:hypothetical protein
MSRYKAAQVTCPKCGAPPNTPCMGKRGARTAFHIQRHSDPWNGRKAPSDGVRERRCNEIGWVYLISATGTDSVKIGFSSKAPDGRLRSLQTANPIDLRLVCAVRGSRRDEQRYHAQFDHLRVRGEWFQDAPEIREHFAGMLG